MKVDGKSFCKQLCSTHIEIKIWVWYNKSIIDVFCSICLCVTWNIMFLFLFFCRSFFSRTSDGYSSLTLLRFFVYLSFRCQETLVIRIIILRFFFHRFYACRSNQMKDWRTLSVQWVFNVFDVYIYQVRPVSVKNIFFYYQ